MLSLLVTLATLVAIANGACTGTVDLVVAVPASSVVSPAEFDGFEQNLIKLFNYLQIDDNNFNIGLVLYGTNTVDVAWPTPTFTRDQVNTRVTLLSRRRLYANVLGNGNDVTKAINRISYMLNNPEEGRPALRRNTMKMGILFQHGKVINAVDVSQVVAAAFAAKRTGVLMYVVNANGNGDEFPYLSYDGCRSQNITTFSTGLADTIKVLGNGICAAADKNVYVTWWRCLPKQYTPIQPQVTGCKAGDNMIADPNNCAYYFQCGGKDSRPARMACRGDYIFDKKLKACSQKKDVVCYNNVKTPLCPPTGLAAHPRFCSKYSFCVLGVAFTFDCPPGTRFDGKSKGCVDQSKVPCLPPRV